MTRLSSVWDTRGCGSAWAAGQMAPAGEGGCQGPHGKEAKGTVRKSPGAAVATLGSACGAVSQPSVACRGLLARPATRPQRRAHRGRAHVDRGAGVPESSARPGGGHRGARPSASGNAPCCAREADSGGRSVTLSGTCRMRGG